MPAEKLSDYFQDLETTLDVMAPAAKQVESITPKIKDTIGRSYPSQPTDVVDFGTVAACYRWAGMTMLGEEKNPTTYEKDFRQGIWRVITEGSRQYFASKLKHFGPVWNEFYDEDTGIAGVVDLLYKPDARYDRYQAVLFRIAEYHTIKNVQPNQYLSDLARKQLLLGIWGMRKKGINAIGGNVMFICTDGNQHTKRHVIERKLAWDKDAVEETAGILLGWERAQEMIAAREWPHPSVLAPEVCKNFCPFTQKCDHGRDILEGRGEGMRQLSLDRYEVITPSLSEIKYVIGERIELDTVCPKTDCAQNLYQVSQLRIKGSERSRISVHTLCPDHGTIAFEKINVPNEQLIIAAS
jgi:hypothetical protein